ncbi:hypothetical protein RhiJN_12262 [Ceratobasidium sp. AG-Ba]|nr:hypothetical protein RhiJN_12262 [Ceratobasidium sp. AG-Ba]
MFGSPQMADSAPATTAQPPVVTRQSTMTIDSDEKAPEPTNPPRAYDPQVERAGQSPTEPATAVNSIVLEEGLLKTPRPAAPAGEPAQADEAQREIPVEELPLVVRPFSAKMRKYLMDEVDTNIASYPLAGYCFMTGYTDAITYTAAYVCTITFPTTMPEEASWNPLAAEQWEWRRDWGLSTGDGQALASLLAFLFGAFVGRLGDKIGPRKRAWLIFGTFIQALFSLAASLTCWANGESSFGGARGSEFTNWGTVLGFLTISFAARAWVSRLMRVFVSATFSIRLWVKQRDHKAIAILGLIVGMVGRALVNKIGAHWTFGLGFVIRILIALSWLSIPAAKPKKK